MFAKLSRSWSFAKTSYGIMWRNKALVVFPMVSTFVGFLVLASFIAGLFGTGLVEFVNIDGTQQATVTNRTAMYAATFLFYFVSYFVIVFFNSALLSCAFRILAGEPTSVGDGLSQASKRIPQIAAWAFLSAVIGLLLRAIENAHEKAGEIISAILGSGWTALTFFVVPSLVLEGLGPIAAIKRSFAILKETWGEALVGNFSLGFLSFLISIPALLVAGLLIVTGLNSGSTPILVGCIGSGVGLVVLVCAFTSAADVVFKAVLYNYATDRALPGSLDKAQLSAAFAPKK